MFTSSYRKVYAETLEVTGPRTVAWDLRDTKGVPVAVGLYYIQVRAGSATPVILKVLVQ